MRTLRNVGRGRAPTDRARNRQLRPWQGVCTLARRMRKLLFLFTPVTLAFFTLMACESDSPGGGPTPSLDSGLPDAPPSTDGGQQADATPDAAPSVSVTVTGGAGPKAGVRVVFHDANGAVMETKLTGNDGKATHTGATPSMVSALVVNGRDHQIVTWTGVELGDDLQLGATGSEESLGMYSVTFSGQPDGASIIDVEGPCGSNFSYGTATELPMYGYCSRAQNAVLATARTYSGKILGHAFKKGNAAISDGGTGSIVVGDWTEPSSLALSVDNVPVDTSYNADLLEVADGAGFRNTRAEWGDFSVTYPTATGFAEAYQASVMFGGSGAERAITKRMAPGPKVSFDYDDLLPRIEDATVVTTDPRRPVASWTTSASTAGTDGGLVRLSFSGPDDSGTYAWTFVVPPGATTVTAPAMPVEAESFLPPAVDSGVEASFGVPKVLLLEADVLSGYAAFRRQQGALLGSDLMFGFGAISLPVLPTNGTYRTTSWAVVPR